MSEVPFQSTVSLGGVPREQKMLKGHLPNVIYHHVYSNIRRYEWAGRVDTGRVQTGEGKGGDLVRVRDASDGEDHFFKLKRA